MDRLPRSVLPLSPTSRHWTPMPHALLEDPLKRMRCPWAAWRLVRSMVWPLLVRRPDPITRPDSNLRWQRLFTFAQDPQAALPLGIQDLPLARAISRKAKRPCVHPGACGCP